MREWVLTGWRWGAVSADRQAGQGGGREAPQHVGEEVGVVGHGEGAQRRGHPGRARVPVARHGEIRPGTTSATASEAHASPAFVRGAGGRLHSSKTGLKRQRW